MGQGDMHYRVGNKDYNNHQRLIVSDKNWSLSIDQAKDARVTTLGVYYRVNKCFNLTKYPVHREYLP